MERYHVQGDANGQMDVCNVGAEVVYRIQRIYDDLRLQRIGLQLEGALLATIRWPAGSGHVTFASYGLLGLRRFALFLVIAHRDAGHFKEWSHARTNWSYLLLSVAFQHKHADWVWLRSVTFNARSACVEMRTWQQLRTVRELVWHARAKSSAHMDIM